MTEIFWSNANELVRQIKKIGCDHPIAVALKATSTLKPNPDAQSTILCKFKVIDNVMPDNCSIIDGSYCPCRFSVSKLQKLIEPKD